MALAKGARLGPYEIISPLGSGGMGEVYRAHDSRLGRDVAIKVLPAAVSSEAERLRRFEQEARATAALNHPNLLAVFDIGSDHGLTYIVSELLDGRTLRDVLGSPLPVRKAIEYAAQIAQGLAAAHDKGIVHRDLKPENIFVTNDGRIKILDFGLAKLTEAMAVGAAATMAPTRAVDTTPGLVLGTVGYMSPEQVRGEPVDHRSDIFSFGAILYEMLSGERAFSGATSVDTMSAILHAEPQDLSRSKRPIPPALERIVRHCLEKSPSERFQSARDLAFDIKALSVESSIEQAARPSSAVAWMRRRVLPIAMAAGFVIAGVLIGRWLLAGSAIVELPRVTQLTFERGLIEAARFAPAADSVIYSASWEGRPLELFTTRLESPEARPLGVASANLLAVSPGGEMAVALGARRGNVFGVFGTLARVPVVGGTPREVAENITEADWTPDGGRMLIIRQGPAAPYDYKLEFPIGTVLLHSSLWISHPRLSPDSRLIAFIEHRSGDDGHVVVMDTTGKRIVTSTLSASVQGLDWAPGGSEVWFSAAKIGARRALHGVGLNGRERVIFQSPTDLALQDIAPDGRVLVAGVSRRTEVHGLLAGLDQEQALSAYDWGVQPVLSHDGSMVVFNESGEGVRTAGVFLRRANSPFPVRLGDGGNPSISPDGKWVSAIAPETPSSTTPSLWLLPVGAGEVRRLDRGNIETYRARADWFPGSKRLMFTAIEKGSTTPRTFEQAIDGPPKRLDVDGNRPSPDGQRFVCRRASEVGICEFADSKSFAPMPAAKDLTCCLWAADGQSVFASRAVTNSVEIYRIDLKSGRRSVWKRIEVADPAGLVFVSTASVSPDGRAYAYIVSRNMAELFVIDGLK